MTAHTAYKDLAWSPLPDAEQAVQAALAAGLARSPALSALAERLLAQAGVRLRDVVDHLETADARVFRDAGWTPAGGALRNARGLFPTVRETGQDAVWLRVESVDDFLVANGIAAEVEGRAHGPLRKAVVRQEGGLLTGIVERAGEAGFDVAETSDGAVRAARLHLQAFRARRRQFDSVAQGLAHTEALVDAAVADIGPHWACDLWLKAERDYWMGRCAPGRLQKARQDAVGIGWANIDHHTYDGSREHFSATVRILETLGYTLREMLYAGEMAGWGSQVLWQPVIGSTIFADVDLSPEELTIDFAHEPLRPLQRHRRAGLLSALLGESILEAGLNHVAALYDQRALREQLAERGHRMMAPFTAFPHLYQELTEGDWIAVEPSRVDALEAAGHLGTEEAEKLRLEGSIVAHLENIERNDGYKGFNRDGIDAVLRKLDPRAYHGAEAVSA